MAYAIQQWKKNAMSSLTTEKIQNNRGLLTEFAQNFVIGAV